MVNDRKVRLSLGYAPVALMLVAVHLVSSVSAQLSTAQIQELIDREVANRRSKCIIVGLIDSNGRHEIISTGVLSDRDLRRPDGNTMFEIGSITKVFTSLLAADFSLKRKIKLDDPVSKYLPKTLKVPMHNGKAITLLNLASHTAGYPRMPDNAEPADPDNPFKDMSEEKMYDYITRFKYTREIGASFGYSNTGYALLGHILALKAGQDYATLIQEKINVPLGLTNTTIELSREQKANMAVGHSETGRPVGNWDLGAYAPTGGLRSNMNDMLRFAAANLGLIKTKPDLYPAMQLSHIPRIPKGPTEGDVTMGWTLFKDRGHEFLWKDGTTGGYRAMMLLDKSRKVGVVVMSNSLNPINDIAYHIHDANYAVKPYTFTWSVSDTVLNTIRQSNVSQGIKLYNQLKQTKPAGLIFNEKQLDYVAYDLARNGKRKDALEIYQLNAQEFPTSPLVFQSLAEAYRLAGKKDLAIETYEKLLQIDPNNPAATWTLNQLNTK